MEDILVKVLSLKYMLLIINIKKIRNNHFHLLVNFYELYQIQLQNSQKFSYNK